MTTTIPPTIPKPNCCSDHVRQLVASLGVVILFALPAVARQGGTPVQGTIVDATGAGVPGASITLANRAVGVSTATSGANGAFEFTGVTTGSYSVTTRADGFAASEVELRVRPGATEPLRITLDPARLTTEVTVTASRSGVTGVGNSPQVVTVRDRDYISESWSATMGHVLDDNVGIEIQQTTYGQASPILRGLTGYHVLNLVDGVRYNNSIFRSGPNQYLAFVDPARASRVETVMGPAAAQYGSDSLGGTINVLTTSPAFSMGPDLSPHLELRAAGNSADLSGHGSAELSLAGRKAAWLVGLSGRMLNDLRAGGGADSHNIFNRYFGLDRQQIKDNYGTRLQDTGFAQYGGLTKLILQPTPDQNWMFSYSGTDTDRVRQYRNLFGGRARIEADLEPEVLQMFVTRYEKIGLGAFDSVSGTFSVNSQRTGSTSQNERATDTIIEERNGVDVFGYSGQATTHFGDHSIFAFGGDIYNERVQADRHDTDPLTFDRTAVRPLYPDGSRYTTYAAFAENSAYLVDGRLRVTVGGRWTNVRVRTFADTFGAIDSKQSYSDVSFNTAVGWIVSPNWRANFVVSRGFRAPNMNDLGAIGFNSLGYEIPVSEAAPFGALVGDSAGEDALPISAAASLDPEHLFNYEFGFGYNNGIVQSRIQLFDAEFYDPIVRRTLLFPAASAPASLSGVALIPNTPTPEQEAQGLITLGTALDPLGLKAFVNDGRSRRYGLESITRIKINSEWSVEANYSFLAGRQLNPNRHDRRLVPQMGVLKIRYMPRSRVWLELAGRFAGPQEKLSGGDLSDERLGQSRSRSDIARVFNGAVVSGWIETGIDGVRGTADDVFSPTGETLLQVQDRILPLGSTINGVTISNNGTRAPVFTTGAGWFVADIRAGIDVGENTTLNLAVTNILDRNYRIYGSGVDGGGASAYVGLRWGF